MTLTEAYETLEITTNSTYKQGYDNFRRLAKVYHPDKGGSHGAFVRLTNAWNLLKVKLPEVAPPPELNIDYEKINKRTKKTIEDVFREYANRNDRFYRPEKVRLVGDLGALKRWICVYFMDAQTDKINATPYKTWVDYVYVNGDEHYSCVGATASDYMPESEHEIGIEYVESISDKMYNDIITCSPDSVWAKPYNFKEIKPNVFIEVKGKASR